MRLRRRGGRGARCGGADRAVFPAVTGVSWLAGLRFASVLVSARMYRMFETVCTFDVILHFQSHQSILWILLVCGLIIMVTTIIPFSPFCLQGNMPVFLISCFVFFSFEKKSKIVTF